MYTQVMRKLSEYPNLHRARSSFPCRFGFMHALYLGRMNASFDLRMQSTKVLRFKYRGKNGFVPDTSDLKLDLFSRTL